MDDDDRGGPDMRADWMFAKIKSSLKTTDEAVRRLPEHEDCRWVVIIGQRIKTHLYPCHAFEMGDGTCIGELRLAARSAGPRTNVAFILGVWTGARSAFIGVFLRQRRILPWRILLPMRVFVAWRHPHATRATVQGRSLFACSAACPGRGRVRSLPVG